MSLETTPELFPRQCAAVIIQNGAGHVLLVKQAYGKRFWALPGGAVDRGETPVQAAVREAREEVGVQVSLSSVVGMYLLQGGGWPDIQAYVFCAEIVMGKPVVADLAEVAEVRWLAPSDVPTWLPNDVAAGLEDWQAGRRGVVRTVARRVFMGEVSL